MVTLRRQTCGVRGWVLACSICAANVVVPPWASAQNAGAQDPEDSRKEWYQVQNDPDLLRYEQADVLLAIIDEQITPTPIGGSYRLSTGDWISEPGCALCPGIAFYGQQKTGRASGILVGDDLVLVARHTFQDETFCHTRAFVFDYVQQSPDDPPVLPPPGSYPGYVEIPDDRVYFCDAIVAYDDSEDWAVIRLDRAVPASRTPRPINRRYLPEVGTPVVNVGHPFRLPMKFEDGAVTSVSNATTPQTSVIRARLNVAPGSSGSMLVNRQTGLVEGLVRTGSFSLAWDPEQNCCVHCQPDCAQNSGSRPAVAASEFIPLIGVDVDNLLVPGVENPLIAVNHRGPIGGPFTNDDTPYRLTAHGTRSVQYEVEVLSDDQPVVVLNGGGVFLSGSLRPGESVDVGVSVNPEVTGVGQIADSTVAFRDLTYGTTEFRQHHVAEGFEALDVQPSDGLDGDGPGALPGGTMTWSIANRYTVPVSFLAATLATTQSWPQSAAAPYLVDGNQVYEVPAGGTVLITAAYGEGYPPLLPWEVYSGGFEFTLLDCCEIVSRDARLDYGRRFYAPDVALPIPLNDPAKELNVPITVVDNFIVHDVDFEVEIQYTSVPRLMLALESPAGTVVALKNEGGNFSGTQFHVVFDDDTPEDDETLTPAESLNSLVDEDAAGTWTFRVIQPQGGAGPGDRIDAAFLRLTPRSPGGFPVE